MDLQKQQIRHEDEATIDLLALAGYLLKKALFIILATILCGAIAFGYTLFFVTPMYSSNARLYVNNSSISVGSAALSISSGDISASRGLISTYAVILDSRETLEEVAEKANVRYTAEQLSKMINAGAVDNTEVFSITVTSSDPIEAALIANTIVEVLPVRISHIIDGTSVTRVDGAIPVTVPVSPNVMRNTIMGAFVGFVLCTIVFVVLFLMDTQIHSESSLISNYPDIPLLAVVPDLNARTASGKYGYGYGYGKAAKSKDKSQ